jgi:hypothetical protein
MLLDRFFVAEVWQYSTIMINIRVNFQTVFAKIGLRLYSKSRRINRLCLRAERNIIDDLSKVNSLPKLEVVKSRDLYLGPLTNINHSHYENIKLLIRVLETRGRLRWLCFRMMPKTFPKSYEYTRLRVLLKILTNWKYFSSTVLSRLNTEERDNQEDRIIDIYEFTHPDIKFKIQKNATYLLGKELSEKITFIDGSSIARNPHTDFILGKLLFWDSIKVMTYLRDRKDFLENSLVSQYLKFFPDFVKEVHRDNRFSLEFHENAYSSFDDISNVSIRSHNFLNNVEIWHQRFIIEGSKWHIIDSTYTPHSKFVAGHWQFMEQVPDTVNHVFIKKPISKRRKRFTHAIFLMGRADENWYHFLLDTLPRYLFMKNIDPKVPVLVRADIPKTSIALIQKVMSRRVVLVAPGDVIAVDTLYFVAARSTVYDSSPPRKIEQVVFSPMTLKRQRGWLLEGVGNENNSAEKIFLQRKSKYRNLLNGEQIGRYLEGFGFYAPEIGEDFFTRQHIYFSKASLIVGPGGAILANILFMKKGSKIVAMRSWRDSKLNLWKSLAEACNVDYEEIIGVPTYFGRKFLARQHSNYFIPLFLVKIFLKR